jgi:hypothetical protein
MVKFKEVFYEMAYPSTFSFEEFENIKSYAGKQKYAAQHLKRLGSGSSRVVYQIDDEKVLKLAKNEKGLRQNQTEMDWGLQQYGTVAKVYDYDDENLYWLEMQLAKKLTVADFKKITGITFQEYTGFIYTLNAKHKDPNYQPKNPERYEELYEDNEFCYSMASMILDYDMPTGDLMRKNSYGVVEQNGEEDVVLVDFGLDNQTYYDYYAR